MHTGLKCAALLLLFAPLGCRSQGELDLAERDMRLQENRIYKLQEYVQQYQQMLEDCQMENESLRKQLADSGRTPDTTSPASAKPRTLRELLKSNKAATEPSPPGPSLTIPATPTIDLGTEFDPTLSAPVEEPPTEKKPLSNPELTPPGFAPAKAPAAPGELPEPDDLPSPSAETTSNQKTSQLVIRTVGQVRGNANMPGGLLIVVEPRSAHGGLTRAPEGAKMSLMIVAGDEEKPMGRWDYSPAQTADAYRAGFGSNSGWRYVVPFSATEETPAKLKLYVRVTLADGTKLIAEREFAADAGASLEEIPNGDAGWFRSRQPIASLANKLGREARLAVSGPQGSGRGRVSPSGSGTRNSRSGNEAPAWQLQDLQPPTVSAGPAASSLGTPAAGNTAPAAQSWSPTEIPTAPLGSPSATVPAAETATRPTRPNWAPYR